jgi:hypothetical protein
LYAKIQLFPKFSAIFVELIMGLMVCMYNRLINYLPIVWVVFVFVSLSQGCEAQSVSELLSKADGLFKSGMSEEARQVHELIVSQDTSCLESTVWLGNFYFLKGEEKRKEAERAFNTLPYPSSMQSAYYQEQLKSICRDYHMKAELLVERALRKQSNEHLKIIEADIEAFKIRLGFANAPTVKKSPIFKLLRSFRDSTKHQ